MNFKNPDKFKSLAGRLLFAGVLALIFAPTYLLLMPKTYRAVTRLKVTNWISSTDSGNPSNPDAAPAESRAIFSDAVIDKVVSNLGLDKVWAGRSHQGVALSVEETRQKFRARGLVQADPKSSLIEIQITSGDSIECARIANELTRVYLEERQAMRRDLIRDKFASLKKQWDVANQNEQEALATQARLYFEITKSRSTNNLQIYDSGAHDLLLKKRAEIEDEFKEQQSQLASFKNLDHEQLRQVLSSFDPDSPLSRTVIQLNKAKNQQLSATAAQGPDSPEVKNDVIIVAEINQRVDDLVEAIMTTKHTELAGLTAMLDDLDKKLKHATTNSAPTIDADARYIKASTEVEKLQQDRDKLQQEMNIHVIEAINPASVTTEIIDTAEVPSLPFSPSRPVAMGILFVGGCLIVAGLLLFVVLRRQQRGAPLEV